MKINLLIKAMLLALGLTFIGLQAFQYEFAAAGVCALLMVSLTLFYKYNSRKVKKHFFYFLVAFSSAQLIGFIYWFLPVEWTKTYLVYYLANVLFIVSYIYLILYLTDGINFKQVIKRFRGPAVILLALDVFCVYIVTDTAGAQFNVSEYILEFTYNGVIMILLSVALLNYLHNDSNKAMLFLIGAIFIVFSEIIQMAYFYILESNDLSATYATFLVMAFLFLYLQSQIENSKSFADLQDDKIKVSSERGS